MLDFLISIYDNIVSTVNSWDVNKFYDFLSHNVKLKSTRPLTPREIAIFSRGVQQQELFRQHIYEAAHRAKIAAGHQEAMRYRVINPEGSVQQAILGNKITTAPQDFRSNIFYQWAVENVVEGWREAQIVDRANEIRYGEEYVKQYRKFDWYYEACEEARIELYNHRNRNELAKHEYLLIKYENSKIERDRAWIGLTRIRQWMDKVIIAAEAEVLADYPSHEAAVTRYNSLVSTYKAAIQEVIPNPVINPGASIQEPIPQNRFTSPWSAIQEPIPQNTFSGSWASHQKLIHKYEIEALAEQGELLKKYEIAAEARKEFMLQHESYVALKNELLADKSPSELAKHEELLKKYENAVSSRNQAILDSKAADRVAQNEAFAAHNEAMAQLNSTGKIVHTEAVVESHNKIIVQAELARKEFMLQHEAYVALKNELLVHKNPNEPVESHLNLLRKYEDSISSRNQAILDSKAADRIAGRMAENNKVPLHRQYTLKQWAVDKVAGKTVGYETLLTNEEVIEENELAEAIKQSRLAIEENELAEAMEQSELAEAIAQNREAYQSDIMSNLEEEAYEELIVENELAEQSKFAEQQSKLLAEQREFAEQQKKLFAEYGIDWENETTENKLAKVIALRDKLAAEFNEAMEADDELAAIFNESTKLDNKLMSENEAVTTSHTVTTTQVVEEISDSLLDEALEEILSSK